MVMVDPHDCHHEKTEPVAEEYRSGLQQGRPRRLRWRAQFEHHNGDDDGDHTVTEGFQTAGSHFAVSHAQEFITEAQRRAEERLFNLIVDRNAQPAPGRLYSTSKVQ